jgi:hypothetical protein
MQVKIKIKTALHVSEKLWLPSLCLFEAANPLKIIIRGTDVQ